MPLRASSHPGSPNSPSCSALAWYSCWPGLSPWGESWNRTRVARTAALTRYRYATQPIHAMTYQVTRSRTTLKFWSATMFGAAARNFGPVHKFELPTVIADSVPRANRVFSLASVGHVTDHMVSHMVPMALCRPPYWKIFTVNNLATVF